LAIDRELQSDEFCREYLLSLFQMERDGEAKRTTIIRTMLGAESARRQTVQEMLRVLDDCDAAELPEDWRQLKALLLL
jgi:hypothetical protein